MKISEIIKQLLSYYDFDKDKIHNAKKGSWIYIHEQGHKKQRKLLKATRIIPEFLMLFILMYLVTQEFYMAKIIFISYILYWMFWEFDAWGYVFYVWYKKRKKVKR